MPTTDSPERSDAAKKLKEYLPIWAELTGVIIKLMCKVLDGHDEREVPRDR